MDSSLNHSYLDRLAETINGRSAEKRLLVVLPNRRSFYVLKEKVDASGESVQLITIDDLMQRLADIKLIEPEELLVSFYEIYCKREKTPQSFDQFASWAITFLSDVNDIDLHLGDVSLIYEHINEYHQTGAWFDEEEAGPIEKGFLSFWERLPGYYSHLIEELKALKLAYRGLIYRIVADLADSDSEELAEKIDNREVYWVGIIPGNPSERKLLSWIESHTSLTLFADVDKFYLDSKMHEAGRLFREYPLQGDLNWKVDLLSSSEKIINSHPIPGKVAQIVKVHDMLVELGKEQWEDCVVVLADSSLLIPFMEVFVADKARINITSGIPMKSTLIHRFVMSWMHMHGQAIQRSGSVQFYHKHIEALLEYAIVKTWLSGAVDWKALRNEIVDRNMKFVSKAWLKEKMSSDLFAEKAFHLLFDWSASIDEVFQRISDVLSEWKKHTAQLGISVVESEAIDVYINKLKLLLSQFNELLPEDDIKSLKRFVHRQIGFTKLYIEQPNNQALQVMGMLETRMIDFKRVIIVGATDDELPGSSSSTTHVPFIHRVHFKLPTKKETEALYAYHFYRLIQRAEQIDLIYSTTSDAMSSGEPSRYILQIKEELTRKNSSISYQEQPWKMDVKASDIEPLRIYKNDEMIEDIKAFLARRVSPSALNKFINSPLEFYYYHVLGLREQDEVEEDIEASTMGSVVHEVLEEIYKPQIGKSVQTAYLKGAMAQTDSMIEERFLEKFSESDLKSGRNLLVLEMAKSYVTRFLEFEINDIERHGTFEILNLEERMNLPIEINSERLRLFGFIDRVDQRNGMIRVIDYKTGLVESKDMVFNADTIADEARYSKALQVAFYKYVYCQIHAVEEARVDSCIFSFRNFKSGYQSIKQEAIQDDMRKTLETLIRRMLDPTEPFQHKADSKYVTF